MTRTRAALLPSGPRRVAAMWAETSAETKRRDRPCWQAANSEAGQAMVELAISLSLILLILLAALDMGRAFFSYISIVNAVREGARYAAVTRSPSSIITAVQRELTGSGVDPGRVTVTYSWGGVKGPVVVNASYPFDFVVTGVLPFTRITLRASATMMIQ